MLTTTSNLVGACCIVVLFLYGVTDVNASNRCHGGATNMAADCSTLKVMLPSQCEQTNVTHGANSVHCLTDEEIIIPRQSVGPDGQLVIKYVVKGHTCRNGAPCHWR